MLCSCIGAAAAPYYGMDPLDLSGACCEILESEVGETQQQQPPRFYLANEARKNRTSGSSIALAIGGLLLKLLHPDLTQESAAQVLCEAYIRLTGTDRKIPNTTFRRRTKAYMAHFTDSTRTEGQTATYGTLSENGWSELKYVLPYLTILSIIDLQREHHYRSSRTVDETEKLLQVDDIFLHSLEIIDQRRRTDHSSSLELQNTRQAGLLELPLATRTPLEPRMLPDYRILTIHSDTMPMEQAWNGTGLIASDSVESQFEIDQPLMHDTAIIDHHLDFSDSPQFGDIEMPNYGSMLHEEFSPLMDVFDEANPIPPLLQQAGFEDHIIEDAHHLNALDIIQFTETDTMESHNF